MQNGSQRIDLKKLAIYLLKRSWLIILCGIIGFVGMYWYTAYYQKDTYTAFATCYVLNGNPNLVNYQYTNANDLSSAVLLLDTYMVVVKSSKVMNVVAERLNSTYPGITANYIASTLSMSSVSDTGVLQISSTTPNRQLSADICNAVVDVAPAEIIRVVSAGSIEIIDYAEPPIVPDYRSPQRKGMVGGLGGAVFMGAILVLLFLLNHKVTDKESIEYNYVPPVLAGIKREKKNSGTPAAFLLKSNTSMEITEGYAKLRMNLLYTLVGKDKRIVVVTSAISGEGKSTIAANLAITCSTSGKRVLLIDADMRRACQKDYFEYEEGRPGLSEVLVGSIHWWDAILCTENENLDILPAGQLPPNPAELLSLPSLTDLFAELQQHYDLVLMDTPPINVVSDPLVLSPQVAGCILIIRQNYTDHREIRKALASAEMTGMNVLGFAYYGEDLKQGRYYGKNYYGRYYNKQQEA